MVAGATGSTSPFEGENLGSNPSLPTTWVHSSMAEQPPFKRNVAGPSPAEPTMGS